MIEIDYLLCHNEIMIIEKRWNEILDLLENHDMMQVKELSDALGVSEAPIRRDLVELDRLGKLVKVHGGVLKKGNDFVMKDLSMSEKHNLNPEEKQRIAKYAANLIKEEDFVYIDAGTTTEALAKEIQVESATYVTNSLTVARILIQKGFRTILPGGEVKTSTEAMIGSETIEAISRFNFTIGFFGTNGVNEKNGFTTPEMNEAMVKKEAMKHTKEPYVLCDHSKFQIISPISFADYEAATIITDAYPKHLGKKTANVLEVKEK